MDNEKFAVKHVLEFLDTSTLREMKRPSKRLKACAESLLEERLPNVTYDEVCFVQLVTTTPATTRSIIASVEEGEGACGATTNSNNRIRHTHQLRFLTGGRYAGNTTVQVKNPLLEEKVAGTEDEKQVGGGCHSSMNGVVVDPRHYYEWKFQSASPFPGGGGVCDDFPVAGGAVSKDPSESMNGNQNDLSEQQQQEEGQQNPQRLQHISQRPAMKYGDIVYLQKVNNHTHSNLDDLLESRHYDLWLKGGEGTNQETVNTIDFLTNDNSSGGGGGTNHHTTAEYQWKICVHQIRTHHFETPTMTMIVTTSLTPKMVPMSNMEMLYIYG